MNDYLRFRDRFKELIDQDHMYTIEQLDHALMHGEAQFWHAGDSAMVTRIVHYPGGDTIGQVDWAVGSLNEILSRLMSEAEAFLFESGCTRIMFEGRPGWKRVLREHGYKDHSVTLIKDAA